MEPSDSKPSSPGGARVEFLAAAGEVLASSLDYEQTLQRVASLAVPVLGDLCIVDVADGDELKRVAIAHVSPAKSALIRELQTAYPPGKDSPQPAARVLRSGKPDLLEHVTPEVVSSHTRDEVHAQLIRSLGIRSHVAVPLVARGSTVGVISLGITESDRRYGAEDVVFAQDLARRAALAIDNARLYRTAQLELAERGRAEEALRLSEQRFRAILDQSPLSTQILEPGGMTLRVNRAWEQLWGVTGEQMADYNILADPQLEARGIAPLLRRAFAGEPVDLPAIRYDPNETIPDRSRYEDPARWVRAFAYPVKDQDGSVREVVLVHEDVTEAYAAQDRVRVSEERLRLALGAARMNVWDWNLDSDVVECSENAREFWGLEIGRADDFRAVVHPDDLTVLADAVEKVLSGGSTFAAEYRLVAGGTLKWVDSRGRVERTADGRPRRILGVTVDITELREAVESTRLLADAGGTLGESLDYHATLRNLAQLLVPRFADWCAVDLLTETGALERVSVYHADPARVLAAQELFRQYPPQPTAPSGAWHVLNTLQPEWTAKIDDAALSTAARDEHHLALLRDLQLRSSISVPLAAHGRALGVLTLVHAESGRHYKGADVEVAMDLARRVSVAVENARLYQQLRTEDRRKDEFLATLAHELRNPLAPIRTGLAVLRGAGDAAASEQALTMMDRQLGHMVRLIDDLLDLSRVTRGRVTLEKARLELHSVVATAVEATRPMIEAAGVELAITLPREPLYLDADGTRLAQVLGNLLSNATKFTGRGGRIELGANVEAGNVVIHVSDTGIGIAPHMLAHIFDMFVQAGDARTRAHGGLGIGLTLVRRLVELHNGEVWAESEGEGRGSRFSIRLPTAASVTVPTPKEAPARPRAESRRVLVVDDNADAADMLAMLLSLDGHEARTAASGPEALALVESFTPDIVFLDIGLPGMNGYEVAVRLRALPGLATTTLVAVTGWGQDEDRRQSKNAGIDHHLTKPVDPDAVRNLVV